MSHPIARLLRVLRHPVIIAAVALPLVSPLRANDATVDLSFATHETPRAGNDVSGVRAVLVQPDGKIVIGGDFSDNFRANNITGAQQNIARLKTDGHYDPTFALASVNDRVQALAIQADGKLLIGGFFSSVGSLTRDAVARLNPDGTPDASFGPAGSYSRPGSNTDVRAIAVQPDGKILIGGAFRITLADGTLRDNLMRLNADGTVDPSFSEDENALVLVVGAIHVQDDGTVLVGSTGGSLLVRLNADGSQDTGFKAKIYNGTAFGRTNDTVRAIAVQPDGKIIAGGSFVAGDATVSRGSLARFNADGSVDASFDAGFNVYTAVYGVALQADGKIIAGGVLATTDGVQNHSVGRFNADGSVDAGFNEGTGARIDGGQFALIYAVALQADGKALIGGNLVTYQDQARAGVARLGGGGSTTTPPTGQKLAELNGSLAGMQSKPKAGGTKALLKGTLTVRNDGAKPAKKVVVAAYLSDDQSFSATDDRPVGTVRLADAGFSKLGKKGKQAVLPVKFKAKLSDGGSTGGKYLVLVIDPDNTVKESDETNNVVVAGPLP